MTDLPFATFVQNAALLLAVSVVFELAAERITPGREDAPAQVATGLVLGVIGISILLTPFQFAPGLFFDARGVLLTVAGLFFGAIPAITATACMIAFRLVQGGGGAATAVVVLVVATAVGLAWRHWRRGDLADVSLRELWVLGLVSSALVLLVAVGGIATTLSAEVAGSVLRLVVPPAMVVEPVATALLGGLMANRLRARRLTEQNTRLRAEVEAQLAEVRASRARIVAAGDAERRRVERDLHDGAQQRLVGLVLALRLARTRVGEDADPRLVESLDQASEDARAALQELRDLARGIHPQVLAEGGLGPALESLADRAPVRVDLAVDLAGRRFEPTVESTAYFMVAEALTNVAKYAGVDAARVRASVQGHVLEVAVEDGGTGGAVATTGSGLSGLADRLAAVDGSLAIESPPGAGTRVVGRIPLRRAAESGTTLYREEDAAATMAP